MDFVLTNGGKNSHSSTKKIPTAQQRKFPQLQFCFSESGTKSRSWDSFYPPTQHKAQHQWSHQCIHCMHTLHAYFDQSWKNLHFLVRVGKFYIFWFEWKFCSCLGSELGKCQILSRVGKFYPPELEKSWLQRKKSNLAIFFNFDFNF